MNDEKWMPTGRGGYEASSLGRIRRAGRILKPAVTARGYHRVSISVNSVCKGAVVHRLVIEAFRGPIPAGFTVNHIDGNKTNNRLENLEMLTAGDNTRHAVRTGLHPRGARHGSAKLTEENVREIKVRLSKGEPAKRIARDYGVHGQSIYRIRDGYGWRHVDGPPALVRRLMGQGETR